MFPCARTSKSSVGEREIVGLLQFTANERHNNRQSPSWPGIHTHFRKYNWLFFSFLFLSFRPRPVEWWNYYIALLSLICTINQLAAEKVLASPRFAGSVLVSFRFMNPRRKVKLFLFSLARWRSGVHLTTISSCLDWIRDTVSWRISATRWRDGYGERGTDWKGLGLVLFSISSLRSTEICFGGVRFQLWMKDTKRKFELNCLREIEILWMKSV